MTDRLSVEAAEAAMAGAMAAVGPRDSRNTSWSEVAMLRAAFAALPPGSFLFVGEDGQVTDGSEKLAMTLNRARNALVAGRSALACGESLSPKLREHMSRAIADCEDAVIALAALSATESQKWQCACGTFNALDYSLCFMCSAGRPLSATDTGKAE